MEDEDIGLVEIEIDTALPDAEHGEPGLEFDDSFAELESENSKFAKGSIEEAVQSAGVEQWTKVIESPGGDVLQKESKGREWLYRDEGSEKTSLTADQTVGGRHKEILNDLYDKGFAISEYQKPELNILVKEVYFADEKGNIFYQIFEREPEEPEALIEQFSDFGESDGDGVETPALIETSEADLVVDAADEEPEAKVEIFVTKSETYTPEADHFETDE